MRHLLFGNLGYDALPFYSAIATGAASVVVLGALAVLGFVTWIKGWKSLWIDWLTSVDHKRIGIMYVVVSFVMLARAVVEAAVMRSQQAVAYNNPGFIPPEHFAQLFTTHGTIMIFFMAMPFLIGIYNFAMPLQIGARDVSFPAMNSISLGLTSAGAVLMMISLCIGKFSTGGWTGYPPYTELSFSPGVGVDYWIWALTLSSIGNTMTGINFAVTIYKKRAPGMTLFRMPLFAWTALCISILMIFAMPPLTVATLMLAMDRYLGMHFFTNELGGNMMNYINMFWLFGHPEVYILILPAFGVYSETIATFSNKRLYGYTSLVWATISIAVLSFTVWLHHFFTMGQDGNVNAIFGIATMLIAIPTGVKVYDWLLTMVRGRIRISVPMLYACAFMVLFVVGGATGVMLANPGFDYQVHNTLFLVAHFHNMLIPGLLFGMLSAYHYWFPKAFGFRLHEGWGRIIFGCWVGGFILAFMPLYIVGALGMPRRSQEFFEAVYRPYLWVALCGALLVLCALASMVIQLWTSIRDRQSLAVPAGDPWNGRTLEWSIAAPPPEYNFALIPQIDSVDAFHQAKKQHTAWRAPEHYYDIELPSNTPVGFVCCVASGVFGFALTWHVWWAVLLGAGVFFGAIITRSFNRDTFRIIPAAEIRETEERWLLTLRESPAIANDAMFTTANRGLVREPV
ncbi:cytochrome o ubiquinol oxidase subunit I [Asaia krungthepensis NRIC 0535]|uniref:Cytochrome o ubiquinol oxidase subunit I n=1 Tax=Asaia krungthepensis NRIC 0535 TaxID=1307925 RepID=A0ABQ0Q013_9PROT|nr:cbb3-type cytochrome c oxidase subunit I [Asaia krungthepensis]GBQ85805.1 cytochrome o ubiquinol oxidase subunit I [Asaia krungthepensis NRIC 0535]